MTNHMIINGRIYPVINSWVEVESPSDGRIRWGIVTEAGQKVPETDESLPPCVVCGESVHLPSQSRDGHKYTLPEGA